MSLFNSIKKLIGHMATHSVHHNILQSIALISNLSVGPMEIAAGGGVSIKTLVNQPKCLHLELRSKSTLWLDLLGLETNSWKHDFHQSFLTLLASKSGDN